MSYKVNSILPGHIVENNPQLVAFLEKYYHFLEEKNGPTYAIDQLVYLRDIDAISEEFIEFLQREFASNIPKGLRADKRKLYKHITDLYRSRGSIPSFISAFNFLFNEQVELYYPRVDILKPSDGKWNQATQKWTTNDGFLNDTKYIQDSYYYQSFSYVIKTGQGVEVWRDYVKKVLHPAGFRFFGEILIQTFASGSMPTSGISAGSTDIPPYIIDTAVVRLPIAHTETSIDKQISALNSVRAGPTLRHFDQTESNNQSGIYNYYGIVINDALIGEDTNFVHPAEIQSTPS
jgi:hypothetical protein